MIVSDITELSIITILHRGTPNEECIAIRANERINLGQYGIMLGVSIQPNAAIPFKDHLFWFGDGFIEKGDWLFIYTGMGEPRKSTTTDGVNNIFTIFWGKPKTVFADTNIVPLLIRVDAVDVLSPPENLPQIGNHYGPTIA
ncbi:MAG: hypothetical protein A3J94_00630 [Syntrophus sp. RIFOXYC2_FULL_54_9]|nr:MAG: hypothetical protein A3J94_00630 [Syntrophus sp. RIFOXYC2_FULL_54_9]